jgi:hypothetical protein
MDDGRTPSSGGRVVVLSLDVALAAVDATDEVSLEVVRADSAYEAAAELLAAPTSALVLDLRLLAPRHLRLLEIARSLDVEMLAVGTLPKALSTEDLSRVRLIARRDLPDAVAAAVAEAGPTELDDSSKAPTSRLTEAAEPAQMPATPDMATRLPSAPPSERVISAPRSASTPEPQPAAPKGEDSSSVSTQTSVTRTPRRSSSRRASETPPTRDARRGRPGSGGTAEKDAPKPEGDRAADGLLTPEEISALLGDDP